MKFTFYNTVFHLIFLLILALLFSCKTSKPITTELQSPKNDLYKRLKDSSIDYHWYSAKAKVRLESSDLNGGGRMNIRMVNDSIIWFNFKKISIEGARGIIEPNNYTILYRTEKKYEKGLFENLFNKSTIPLSFSELQSFIAGNVPLPLESTINYVSQDEFHLIEGRNETYHLVYTFDKELNLIEYVMTVDQNRKLVVQIKKLDKELGVYRNRKLTYYQNHLKSGILEVDLSNIEVDIPKKLPFSIPGHYTQY